MTSEYPPSFGIRMPPAMRWSLPGLGGGPDDGVAGDRGLPEAGDVVLTNGVPVAKLVLGVLAGRPVTVETTDLEWLDGLIYAATLEKSRLAAFHYGSAA